MSTHPASATKSLVIREPVDLIALAPVVLGFQPEESVVLETFDGASGSFHARADLSRGHPDQDAVARHLVAAAERNGAVQAAVVVFSAHLARARRQGRVLRDLLHGAGIQVIDVLCADGTRFHQLNGGKAAPGSAYDLAAHPFLVQHVFDGQIVHPTRDGLARTLVAIDGPDRDEVAAAVDRFTKRPSGAGALRAEALWIQGCIRRFRRTRRALAAPEAGRLLALCRCDELWEVAWSEMERPHGDAHVEFWRDLVRRAPEDLVGRTAGLLAFAAWLHGDGALAWCAIERSREGGLQDELAEEVGVALMGARPPDSWTPFRAGVFDT